MILWPGPPGARPAGIVLMKNLSLTTVDWAVLVFYLVGIAMIGVLAGRAVRSTDHFFLGGRRFSKWLMIGQSFGTGTHADMPVSLAGAVYSFGLSAIWFQWKNLFVTPFYWMFAPVFRRVRRTTTAEVMEDRYGALMGAIYTVYALIFFMIAMAGMLKGAAKVIVQAAGADVPVNGLIVAMTAVFLLYSFIGGLVATAWTDFLQGFLILVLSFLLIPLGWEVVGGLGGIRATLGDTKLSLATPEGIGPAFIAILTLNGLVGVIAQPHLIAAVGTGRTEHACRTGMLYGNLTKRICTVGWAVVGLMAAALVVRGAFGVTALQDPEEAFGFACRHLLFQGGVGLLIASVLATNMAGCSAFMVNSGALFTKSLYARYLVKDKPDAHYLWVGRVSGLLITLASALYSVFLVERILYSFLLMETMATYMGVSLLAGICWKRATRWGAISSLAVALVVNFSLYAVRGQRLDYWDPWVFLTALGAGLLTMVVVSLATPREAPERLELFYGRLQTPAEAGDPAPGAHEPSPEHAAKGQQLLVVNLLQPRQGAAGQGFLRAYREDLGGFVKGWGIVLALVALVWLIFR